MSDSDEWASASDSELQDREDREFPVLENNSHSGDATSETAVAGVTLGKELIVEESPSKDHYEADPKLNLLAKSDSQAGADTSQDNTANVINDRSPDALKESPPTYDENELLSQENEVSSKEEIFKDLQNVKVSPSDKQVTGTSETGVVVSRSDASSSTWGDWGSSWLSKAATSVASGAHNLANSTEHGLSSILSSVESSMGIPTPESMATRDSGEKAESVSSAALGLKEIAQRLKEEQNSETQSSSSNTQPTPIVPGNDVGTPTKSQISNSNRNDVVEHKPGNKEDSDDSIGFFASYGISLTNKLVTGGLDSLENLGKKTMDYLSEGDPGLRNKRTFVQDQIQNITNEVSVTEKQVQDTEVLTSFHAEFEKLQGYVYLEALEILSSECEAKQRLKMHSISTKREEPASDGVSLLKESFEINFDTEVPSCHWDEMFPSAKGMVGLERIHSTVGELDQCSDKFETIDTSNKALLPHLNLCMHLLAKLSSQYVQTVRKVSELCLAQQLRAEEALPHSRQLALLAYRAVDRVTTQIALVEVSDDVIGNKFILDMNSAVTYVQDSFSLMRSVLIHAK